MDGAATGGVVPSAASSELPESEQSEQPTEIEYTGTSAVPETAGETMEEGEEEVAMALRKPKRDRRKSAKYKDYADEEEGLGSDDSENEEGGERVVRTPAYSGRGRPPKAAFAVLRGGGGPGRPKLKRSQKECPGCMEPCPAACKACPTCDYAFPAGLGRRPVDPDEANVRERITFSPEREEDGSLKVDVILGHRPVPAAAGGQAEKHTRFMHTPLMCEVEDKYNFEYLIKFRGMAYARCKWMTPDDVEQLGQRAKQALTRYLRKHEAALERGEGGGRRGGGRDKGAATARPEGKAKGGAEGEGGGSGGGDGDEAAEDGYFNPIYLEVERLLDDKWAEEDVELEGEELTRYLEEEKARAAAEARRAAAEGRARRAAARADRVQQREKLAGDLERYEKVLADVAATQAGRREGLAQARAQCAKLAAELAPGGAPLALDPQAAARQRQQLEHLRARAAELERALGTHAASLASLEKGRREAAERLERAARDWPSEAADRAEAARDAREEAAEAAGGAEGEGGEGEGEGEGEGDEGKTEEEEEGKTEKKEEEEEEGKEEEGGRGEGGEEGEPAAEHRTRSKDKAAEGAEAEAEEGEEEEEDGLWEPDKRWKPMRRCLRVLERLGEDPGAGPFLEPVPTDVYDDYLDVVERPMDLGTAEQRLRAGEYKAPEAFHREVRRVWNNCKVYNKHGSAIWHTADLLSKQCDRLMAAWVFAFRDRRDLRWALPLARPWEPTCRGCQEARPEDDTKLLLCDHCDAPYHTTCLTPRLKAVPVGAWLCPRCVASRERLASHAAEEAARALAERAEKPVKKVRRRLYLAKWRGLSYRDCTWESREDLNDDGAIAAYHALNDAPPEDPPLTQAEIRAEVAKATAGTHRPAHRAPDRTAALEAQCHAQVRALHFARALTQASGWGRSKCPVPLPAKPPAPPSSSSAAAAAAAKEITSNTDCMPHSLMKCVGPRMAGLAWSLKKSREAEQRVAAGADEEDSKSKIDEALSASLQKDSLLAVKKEPTLSSMEDAKLVKPKVEEEMTKITKMMDVSKTGKGGAAGDASTAVKQEQGKPVKTEPGEGQGEQPTKTAPEDGQGERPVKTEPPFPPAPTPAAGPGGKGGGGGGGGGGGPVPKEDAAAAAKKREGGETAAAAAGEGGCPCVLPAAAAAATTPLAGAVDPARAEVAQVLGETVFRIERDLYPFFPKRVRRRGAARRAEASVEKGAGGLCMNIAQAEGGALRVLGFRPGADGAKGAAEKSGLVEVGDLIVGVNGYDTKDLPFQTAINLLVHAESKVRLILERAAAEDREEVLWPRTPEYAWAHPHIFGPNARTTPAPAPGAPPAFPRAPRPGDALRWALELAGSEGEETDSEAEEAACLGHRKQVLEVYPHLAGALPPPPPGGRPRPDLGALRGMGRLHLAVEEADPDQVPPVWQGEWAGPQAAPGAAAAGAAAVAHERGVPVRQRDLATGQPLRTFASATQAARALRLLPQQVTACLRGQVDSAGGYAWEYAPSEDGAPGGGGGGGGPGGGGGEGAGGPGSPPPELAEAEGDKGGDLPALSEAAERAAAAQPAKRGGMPEWRKKLMKKGRVFKNDNQLRDYQTQGVNWLLRCWYQRRGCILADEMGLGKTVQVVMTLNHLYEVERLKGPFLVVVPLSTLEHWRREVEAWTDMVCCVYHDIGGGKDFRDVIREYEWYYRGRSRRLLKFQVLVTTYDDLIKDYEELAEVPWRCVAIDEAHRLKNQRSKLLECMQLVMPNGQVRHGYQQVILMTGTPLQNNMAELWSLLNFIEPAKFPDLEKFEDRFGDMQSEAQVRALQRRLEPHLLRRVKEDVADEIPPKRETVVDVELTTTQKQYYRAIFERNHAFLFKGTKGALPKLMNIQMELRKCCNHPFLTLGVEAFEMDRLRAELGRALGRDALGTQKAYDELEAKRVEQGLIMSSGKMVLVDKLLPKLRREGHRVLFFSQMVRVLDLLEEFCEYRGYPCERLDGRITGNARQESIDRFNRDPDSFVFLLSTRAGGVGINLTAADTVIIFDSDWNPQNDVQAQARCHRIGQTKDVMVYRLITRRSFEAEMFERASRKLGLEQAVLGTASFSGAEAGAAGAEAAEEEGGEGGGDPNKIATSEVERLLKQGAYYLLNDDEEDKRFCEDDIEKILAERTRVRLVENGRTADWLSKKRGKKKEKNVTKARFAGGSASKFEDVDVDDPDFWKKVMPDLVSVDDLASRLKTLDPEEDEEVTATFLEDLGKLAKQLQKLDRQQRLPPQERDKALKLLLQVSVREDDFEAAACAQANRWMVALEGSRRGKRGAAGGSPGGKGRHKHRGKKKRAGGRDVDEWGVDGAQYSTRPAGGKGKKRARRPAAAVREGGEGEEGEAWGPAAAAPVRGGASKVAGKVIAYHQGKKDFHQPVCTICEDGGLLLMCDGRCMRSFHKECLGIEALPEGDEPWLCPDCEAGRLLCLLCGEAGEVDATGAGAAGAVAKCQSARCGRHYHRACLAKDARPRYFGQKEAKAEDGGEAAAAAAAAAGGGKKRPSAFKCPQHTCRVCLKAAGSKLQGRLLRCVRCPNALHLNCVANLGLEVVPKGSDHMICCWHAPQGQEAPMLTRAEVAKSRLDVEETKHVQEARAPPDAVAAAAEAGAGGGGGRRCRLCNGARDAEDALEGAFLRPPLLGPVTKRAPEGEVYWVHRECALNSPECFVEAPPPPGEEEEGSDGGGGEEQFFNVVKAVRRGRQLKCAGCAQRGATLGCLEPACQASYHLRCAALTGWHPYTEPPQGAFVCPAHRGEDWVDFREAVDPYDDRFGAAGNGEETPTKGGEGGKASKKKGKGGTGAGGGEAPTPEDAQAYCLCDGAGAAAAGTAQIWVGCDLCGNWFHPGCVGLEDAEVQGLGDDWQCPPCLVAARGKKAKRKLAPAAATNGGGGKKGGGGGGGSKKKKEKKKKGPSLEDVTALPATVDGQPRAIYVRVGGRLVDHFEEVLAEAAAAAEARLAEERRAEERRAREDCPEEGEGASGGEEEEEEEEGGEGEEGEEEEVSSKRKRRPTDRYGSPAPKKKSKKKPAAKSGTEKKGGGAGAAERETGEEGEGEGVAAESARGQLFLRAVEMMATADRNGWFAAPVKEQEAPGYAEAIAHPMDLQTMAGKVRARRYADESELEADFRRVFENCMAYNEQGAPIHEEARRLLATVPEVFSACALQISGRYHGQGRRKKKGH